MDKDKIDRILDLLFTVGRLKSIKRKGWLSKACIDASVAESVADHSFMLAFLAMIISDMKGMDTCKAVKIALLHDLAESIVGDYMPEEMGKEEKSRLEDDVIRRLLSLLPEDIAREYILLWEDYLKRRSKEDVLVHELDKFEMALQARVYEFKGYDEALLKQFYDYAKPYMNDEMIKSLFERLIKIK